MIKPLYWLWMVTFFHGTIAGIPVHQVETDFATRDVYVTVCLAKGRAESFDSMCKRLNPVAAITGDFFDPRTLKPIGDIVIDGKIIHDGCIGPALIISAKDGSMRIVSQFEYSKIDKSTLKLGMQTGPILVRHGQVALNLKDEGFCHISRSARRTAIGITADGKLIMAATDVAVTIHGLAQMMLKSGCIDAVALDGGSSTGIYYDGKVKVPPSRLLVSILAIFPTANK